MARPRSPGFSLPMTSVARQKTSVSAVVGAGSRPSWRAVAIMRTIVPTQANGWLEWATRPGPACFLYCYGLAPVDSCDMDAKSFILTFPGVPKDEANRNSQDLVDALSRVYGVARAETQRDNPNAQDFGATVILILGTASATAVAKGIQAWIARTGTQVTIQGPQGNVLLKNIDSSQLPAIVKALSPESTDA